MRFHDDQSLFSEETQPDGGDPITIALLARPGRLSGPIRKRLTLNGGPVGLQRGAERVAQWQIRDGPSLFRPVEGDPPDLAIPLHIMRMVDLPEIMIFAGQPEDGHNMDAELARELSGELNRTGDLVGDVGGAAQEPCLLTAYDAIHIRPA